MKVLFLASVFFLGSAVGFGGVPFIAPLPDKERAGTDYAVSVYTESDPTPRPVGCYLAKVGTKMNYPVEVLHKEMSFCSVDFDFSEPLYVKVAPARSTTESLVLPRSARVESHYRDNVLVMKLTQPTKVSVEFDGDMYHNLFVYANDVEKDPPTDADPNVKYFGPGAHDAGEIVLQSSQTLYLASGAVVYGNVVTSGTENVKILGRGILDGSKFPHGLHDNRKLAVALDACDRITVDGVILRDSSSWTFCLRNCKNVNVRDLKMICYGFNSDGMDIVGCENVLIDRVFLRNHDDNISIKAFDGGNSRNITMQNSVLWADCAHNMLVGPEATPATFENQFANITFHNIDVLEQKESSGFYKGVMAITCSDNAVYDGIRWEDIRVERMSDGQLINFQFSDDYGTTIGKTVRRVRLKNISSAMRPATADVIRGEVNSRFEDVTIDRYTIAGKRVTLEDNFSSTALVRNIDSLRVDGVEKKF